MWIYIIIAIIVLIVIYALALYNSFVKLNNKVKEAFSTMDVYLKKRWDLIPNIVETVKGYAKHEEKTLKEVVEARNKMATASGINEEVEASNAVTSALNKLFALSEAYPELKANENFMSLQADLKETEDKISYARGFYNDTVLTYNNLREQFPSSIIASMFKFEKLEFFNADEKDRENPQVKF